MGVLREFWTDEAGFVISSELVVLGTLGVLGATVGLNMVSRSVNEEMKDLAFALRSLDQSYAVRGFSGCGAYTAGSCFTQRPVKESLAELAACDATDPESRNVDESTPMPGPAVPETDGRAETVEPEA